MRVSDDTPRLREVGPSPAVYHVHRAEIGGSEAIPLARAGQDQETIDEVERLCRLVAIVTCSEEGRQ
jgi:hypothetical protein